MAKIAEPRDYEALKDRLQSDWSARDDQITEMRKLRFMEEEPEVPPHLEAEDVRTPIGHQTIERMVGTITTDPLTITVPPAAETDDARRKSSLQEVWLNAAHNQLQKQADEFVVDRYVESLVADGHGAMRMLYAPQLWRGFPRKDKDEEDKSYNSRTETWKKGKPLPIVWRWLDPLTVYPLYGEFGLEGVLEVDERDILTLHPDRWNTDKPDLEHLSRMHRKNGSSVEFAQWWTPETVTYYVEGEVVHHAKHKYSTPPYVYSFGLGAASNDPARMGMSCLWPVRFLLPYLDRLLSQKGTAIRMWAWPTVIFRQSALNQIQTGEGEAVERDIEIAPGATVTLFQDEELSFLTWKGNGPDADQMTSLVMNMIERAGLSDPMYGRDTGASGYAINQLIAAARMRFKPIVAHAERGIEQMFGTLLDIVEYMIKQKVYVWGTGEQSGWVGLGPDDLKGYRNVHVKLNPILPTDAYARSSQAINEVNAGLRSRASAMEMIGIQQPDIEQRAILVDRWKVRPEVEQWITQQALEEAAQARHAGHEHGETPGAYPNLPATPTGGERPAGRRAPAPGRKRWA